MGFMQLLALTFPAPNSLFATKPKFKTLDCLIQVGLSEQALRGYRVPVPTLCMGTQRRNTHTRSIYPFGVTRSLLIKELEVAALISNFSRG